MEGDAGGRGRVRKGELALWHPGRCGHVLRRSLGRTGGLPEHLPRAQTHQCTGSCPRGRPPVQSGWRRLWATQGGLHWRHPSLPQQLVQKVTHRGCSAGTHTLKRMEPPHWVQPGGSLPFPSLSSQGASKAQEHTLFLGFGKPLSAIAQVFVLLGKTPHFFVILVS